MVALSVNKFDKQLALCKGAFFHYGEILVPDTLFNLFQMLLPCLFIGQILQVQVCFNKNSLNLKRDGVHLHDVAGQFVIFTLLTGAGERASSVNSDLHKLERGYGIAVNDFGQRNYDALLLVVVCVGGNANGWNAQNDGK